MFQKKNISDNSFRLIFAAVTGAFLVMFLWSGYAVLILNQPEVYAENGPIENTQVGLLAISCFLFFMAAVWGKRPDKLPLLFCSLLCYSFVLRELDFEKMCVNPVIVFWGSGVGRDIHEAILFSGIGIYSLCYFKYYANMAARFLTSRSGLLLMMGGLSLLLGHIFEECNGWIYREYFEELFELLGYQYVLLSSIAVYSDDRCPEPSTMPLLGYNPIELVRFWWKFNRR
jgi:hypothetical protein